MYGKFFFERFWEGEQRNILFVLMPFHNSLDSKFELIRKVVKEAGFDDAERLKEQHISDQIMTQVLNGIANSKMLLFDLSNDPKNPCKCAQAPNGNVIYELGLANATREPEDIILIREKADSEMLFDISGLGREDYQGELNEEWLKIVLEKAIKNQKWHNSRRVKAVAQSLDPLSIQIIQDRGRFPVGNSHFGFNQLNADMKLSVSKLIDLGILKFSWAIKSEEATPEYSYDWTPFGRAVMEHKGIKPWTLEEFQQRRPSDYLKLIQQREEYKKAESQK